MDYTQILLVHMEARARQYLLLQRASKEIKERKIGNRMVTVYPPEYKQILDEIDLLDQLIENARLEIKPYSSFAPYMWEGINYE